MSVTKLYFSNIDILEILVSQFYTTVWGGDPHGPRFFNRAGLRGIWERAKMKQSCVFMFGIISYVYNKCMCTILTLGHEINYQKELKIHQFRANISTKSQILNSYKCLLLRYRPMSQ
jgi:hypothetical protein